MLTPQHNQDLPTLQRRCLNVLYVLALLCPLLIMILRFSVGFRLAPGLSLALIMIFPLLGFGLVLSSPLSTSQRLTLGFKHAFILFFLPALSLLLLFL